MSYIQQGFQIFRLTRVQRSHPRFHFCWIHLWVKKLTARQTHKQTAVDAVMHKQKLVGMLLEQRWGQGIFSCYYESSHLLKKISHTPTRARFDEQKPPFCTKILYHAPIVDHKYYLFQQSLTGFGEQSLRKLASFRETKMFNLRKN